MEEEDLSYNDLANLTAASPIVHRGSKKTKPSGVNTKRGSSAVMNMESPSPIRKSGRSQSPVKVISAQKQAVESPISSPIAPGTKVRISKQTEKHTQFRGKVSIILRFWSLYYHLFQVLYLDWHCYESLGSMGES